MKIKYALAVLLAMTMLTGCSSSEVESIGTAEATDDFDIVGFKDISTTCGLYYKEFLKFGSKDASEISAENPDWEFKEEGSKEEWSYDGGTALMFSYWRNANENVSYYTRTFPINTANISSWVDVEVVGIDNLLGAIHERAYADGATWNYSWQSDLENAILQVYSTGEYGKYTGLISFTRSGPTSFSQLPNGGTVEVGEQE